MQRSLSKKIAGTAVLAALALIAFMIESLFPPLFIPGAKMGLSNIFTFLALILYGGGSAFAVILTKCLLGAVFGGNFSALMYSLPASFAAFAAEYALFRFLFPKTSLTAISVTAATLHNIVQNLVFCLVTETPEALIYLPYLALTGAVAGVIVGLAAYLTVKALPKYYFAR